MLPKKSPKGDLERKKISFGLIGIILVLGLVYVGFELFATQESKANIRMISDEFILIEETAPVTDRTPPPPPAPVDRNEYVLNQVEKMVKESIDISSIFGIDFNENDRIAEIVEVDLMPESPAPPPDPVPYAEEMPEFIGGEAALYHFLNSHLIYPKRAFENNIYGTVVVEFVVERDGSVSNVTPIIGIHPDLDAEAVRVVKLLPRFKPGKANHKPVRVLYRIPVKFIMQ